MKLLWSFHTKAEEPEDENGMLEAEREEPQGAKDPLLLCNDFSIPIYVAWQPRLKVNASSSKTF